MKSTTKIMYTIGLILNAVTALILLFFVVMFGTLMNNQVFLEELVRTDTSGVISSIEIASSVMLLDLVLFIVVFAVKLITIVIGILGIKLTNKDTSKQSAFHIVAIVSGALTFELFYILGGAFGLQGVSKKAQ